MNKNIKIALIPILGLVLVYLVTQGSNGVEQTSADPMVSLISDTSSGRTSKEHRPKPLIQTSLEWPIFDIGNLPNTDPFDRRALFPEPLVVATSSDQNEILVGKTDRSAADALKPIKIQAIFQSPTGITALVENRVVHIGDRLEDGSEVVGITPEQLLLMKPTIH